MKARVVPGMFVGSPGHAIAAYAGDALAAWLR